MKNEKSFMIRSYRASDRTAVRRLCCQTGFLGDPIDPVYEDRQLFADFLTTYYTDHEPESCFLLEVDGEIRGYLLGSRKPLRNQLYACVPHFHINLLPDARRVSTTRALMSAYLSYLYRCGEKRVYGQIVTFESRRGEKMFERYGFKVLNRAEITKYKAFYPESVYLSTVIKNLETAEPLSAYSRVRE